MKIINYYLKKTCGACPEQYDVFINGKEIGYLRLRHGCFAVHYLNPSGKILYNGYPKGDGSFEEDERAHYLNKAIEKIDEERIRVNKMKKVFRGIL